ncbi:MAG: hypothetical protein QXL67_02270, partial [Candidatus Bathyarchaeia archaeon]
MTYTSLISRIDWNYLGHVKVRGLLGSPEKKRIGETNFLVDTGAYYTALPPKLTESLAIKPVAKV